MKRSALFWVFLAPVLMWLFLLIVLPHLDLLILSFRVGNDWSLENYGNFLRNPSTG